jgi:hypothetical protein
MQIKNLSAQGLLCCILLGGLSGCANFAGGLQWLFVKPYPVEVSGQGPSDKTNVLLKFSREASPGSVNTSNEQDERQRVTATLEAAGYRLAADETHASAMADVKLYAQGPRSETRSREEKVPVKCDAKGQNCTYKTVQVEAIYAICTYVLHVVINELPPQFTESAQMRAVLSMRSEWQTETMKREYRIGDSLGMNLMSAVALPLLFSSDKPCTEEGEQFPGYLTAMGHLLSKDSIPQGKRWVKEKNGEFYIYPE